jgi:hypothetical protein
VVRDAIYWTTGGGSNFYLNVGDRSGNLLRSIRGTPGVSITSLVVPVLFPVVADTPQTGIPVWAAHPADTFDTSEETYSRPLGTTRPYGGGDTGLEREMLSGPTGATYIDNVPEWTPDAPSAPVVDVHGDDVGTVAAGAYVSPVTCTPSDLHDTTVNWELKASNINGDASPNAAWTTTLETPITWELLAGPSGMSIVESGDPALATLVWFPTVAGVYTVTYRATSHAGDDTDSFELTVT